VLNLTRKVGEELIIDYHGQLIRVRILAFNPRHPKEVRLAFEAPRSLKIAREEVNIQHERDA
jgi:carbon storage regulator CsrA